MHGGRILAAWAVALATLLGVGSTARAGQRLYHLSKVPEFRVGDRVVHTWKLASENTRRTAKGGTHPADETVVSTYDSDAHVAWEVLEVDGEGRVQACRVSVVSSRRKIRVEGPGTKTSGKDTAISKIHFVARREGLRFEWDPTTIVAAVGRARLTEFPPVDTTTEHAAKL